MQRKLALGVGAVGAVLLVVLGTMIASAAASDDSKGSANHTTKVMELALRPRGAPQMVDNAPRGPSVGDEIIFSNDVYQAVRSNSTSFLGDNKVGFDGGLCTITHMKPDREVVCTLSVSLSDGTISAQLARIEPPPPAPSAPFDTAITGGTGAYRNARGYIHVEPVSREVHYITIFLDQ